MRTLLVLVTLAALAGAAGAAPGAGQPGPPPLLDYNATPMPDGTLADFSHLLEPPAGKHGWLRVSEGHFRFADGTPVRFFGVNVAKEAVFQSREVIDRAVAVFARSGINMVRLHHVDDRGGVWAGGKLDEERMRTLDYWVYRLREAGIYTYLDLLDYRTFTEAEGVSGGERLDRGAKPYALFDPKLIELQQAYARALLVEHVNHYTRLPYAQDPAVAIVELCDENGLFSRPDWHLLAEPYRSQLTARWNQWLAGRYGNTESLRQAWTSYLGQCALGPSERLEAGTVRLPRMALQPSPNLDYRQGLDAAARRNDGARFAYDLHRSYYAQMRGYLRRLGVQAALTATVTMDLPPDLKAVARELDATAVNFYWDHPAFDPGADWRSASYFSCANPFFEMPGVSFAPAIASGRVWGKPLIVREWSYCFPNPYRSGGMVEAAAYGAMLGVDALLLFTYQAGEGTRGLSFFDVRNDPARWSLVGPAAQIFLGRAVAASRHRVGVGMGETDTFNYYRYAHPAYRLAWVAPVGIAYLDEPAGGCDLLVASGRSGHTRYGGTDTLMFWNQRNADLGYRVMRPTPERDSGYQVKTGAEARGEFVFAGLGYHQGSRVQAQAWPAFDLGDLRARGLVPIGVRGEAACGFLDPIRRNFVFHNLNDRGVLGVGLDALARKGIGDGHQAVDRQRFRSDTGEILREGERGALWVLAPTVRALAGRLPPGPVALGPGVRLGGCPRRGTLALVSLDRRPVAESGRLLVVWVDDAANRGQSLVRAPARSPKELLLAQPGSHPVTTAGRRRGIPLRIEVAGKPALLAYLEGGAWQALLEGGRATVWCDTPEAAIEVPGRKVTRVGGKGP